MIPQRLSDMTERIWNLLRTYDSGLIDSKRYTRELRALQNEFLSVNREPLNLEPGDIEPGDPEGPPNIADLFHALEQFKEIVKQMNDCAGQDLAQKRRLKNALGMAKKDIEAMLDRV